MKLKNVVEGTQIEAKRNTTGECGEAIAKGAVLDVDEVLEECPRGTYCVRVEAEYLEDGFAWVVPADFRKVKEVSVEEVTEKPTEHVYKVDDKVLVGSEGAGYGYVDRELADKVCTVTAVHADGCLRVSHPEVTSTFGYLTYPRYVSPYAAPAPVKDFREGDVLLCTTACEGKHSEQCIAGRLYTYACASRIHIHRICVADPELYLEQATVLPENFTLYARKVGEDAAL